MLKKLRNVLESLRNVLMKHPHAPHPHTDTTAFQRESNWYLGNSNPDITLSIQGLNKYTQQKLYNLLNKLECIWY